MKLKNLFLVALVVVTNALTAQTVNSKYAIGLNLLKNEYNGDLGSGIWNFKPTTYYGGGLSFAKYLNPSFDMGVIGNYGDYGYANDQISYANSFNSRKLDFSLFGHYKLNNGYILKESAKLSPFVSLGLGFASYSRNSTYDAGATQRVVTGTDFIVPFGAGLKYQITDKFALQYQYLYNVTNHDIRDKNRGTAGAYQKSGNDAAGQHLLGLVFSFGKAKDSDKDGVADKFDNCVETPLNVVVDAVGCPVDTDKDGVADYLDKCPEVAGVAKFDGCPDTDGDGVQDSEDKCPTVAGLAKFAGCPDTDGDGVQDSEDKCPKVAGLAKFGGCPDTDGDGVQDSEDKCPTVAGSLNGCPDRDKDGVADYLDKCPDVPGIAANKGCPEVKAETKKIFQQALQGIQFESGKDIIKKTSFPILNQVVKVMTENPSYQLEINGHTDSQGDDAKNMLLSEKRAAAVKAYLVKSGVDAAKLTSKGYGETVPVADNATAAGKAKNRRVEFKVNF